MYSVIFSPLNYRFIRPRIWRWMGAKIGNDTFIGYEVWMDFNNAELIELEDNVHIANRCLLLCHQRDLSNYYVGSDYSKLPYNHKKIHFYLIFYFYIPICHLQSNLSSEHYEVG